MDLGNGLGHLTYSTLVHPGDTWEEMWASLTTYVPQVKARVCPDDRFGVSLRLSAASAETLAGNAAERQKLRDFLADNDLYLYTVNAFPYGPFKGRVVKEQVYEPDWRSEERTQYTINVADVLADVVDEDTAPSIQTAPLGFKPSVTGPDVVASYTEHVLRVAAHLVALEAAHRPNRHARGRTGAVLLPGDDRRDRRLLQRAPLLRHSGSGARRARGNPHLRGTRSAAPPSRDRLRHLPPGGGVRRHQRVAAEARRRRHSDPQASGGGRDQRPRGDP